MSNFVRYNGLVDRSPSPAIWGDPQKWIDDAHQGRGGFFFEDFDHWSTHTVNTNANIIGASGPWRVLADAGVTANPAANSIVLTAEEHGIILVSGADADNDEAYIFKPHNYCKFDYTSNIKIAYECRFKFSVVNEGNGGAFGLALLSDIAAGFLADNTTDLVATANFLGFHILDAAGATLRTSWQAASQTKQNADTTAGTLTSNTYVKVGFVYEPNAADGKCVEFFINGAPLADYATLTQISAATFPNGVAVVPMVGFKMDGTGDDSLSLDWVACGTYLPR